MHLVTLHGIRALFSLTYVLTPNTLHIRTSQGVQNETLVAMFVVASTPTTEGTTHLVEGMTTTT